MYKNKNTPFLPAFIWFSLKPKVIFCSVFLKQEAKSSKLSISNSGKEQNSKQPNFLTPWDQPCWDYPSSRLSGDREERGQRGRRGPSPAPSALWKSSSLTVARNSQRASRAQARPQTEGPPRLDPNDTYLLLKDPSSWKFSKANSNPSLSWEELKVSTQPGLLLGSYRFHSDLITAWAFGTDTVWQGKKNFFLFVFLRNWTEIFCSPWTQRVLTRSESEKIDGKYLAFKFKSLEFKYEIERVSK